MSAPARLIHCRVRVLMESVTLVFDGFYRSVYDAATDGEARAGEERCKVYVDAIV